MLRSKERHESALVTRSKPIFSYEISAAFPALSEAGGKRRD